MREFFNPLPVCVEITPALLRAVRENAGIELPLERSADGKLTAACHERTVARLQDFLGRNSWQPRSRAACGISAHGVTLRRITLPAVAGDELEQILRLQIENEFPLSPDDLAWGWRETLRDSTKFEAVVVAIRRETIEDYDSLLSAAGLNPDYTLAAFARNLLCPAPNDSHAVLEIARNYAEFVSFENGVPVGLKIVPGRMDTVEPVLKTFRVRTIFVTESTATPPGVWERLSAQADCRRLEVSRGDGLSAATLGLKQSLDGNDSLLWLRSKSKPAKTQFDFSQFDFSSSESRLWLLRGAVLLALLLIFPFAEALVLKPLLAGKLERLRSQRRSFVAVVEPEMRFLQSLKQTQPPYLDTIYIFSKAAPPGLHLDSITINQQGNITAKATLQNPQQVMDFRSSLIASGFFANITVEEQAPIPNQQKVSVRLSAQWKSAATRAVIKIDPPPVDTGKSNGTGTAAALPVNGQIPQT